MELSPELHQKIIKFLSSIPNIYEHNSRQAFIYSAGLDSQLRQQITYSCSTGEFIPILIEKLLNYGILQDGRNALEAILETAKSYFGQEKQYYCEELIEELCLYQKNRIDVPFVIVAMTHEEADELLNESFEPELVAPAEIEIFREIKASFPEKTVERWLANYASKRDLWKPHYDSTSPAKEIISKAIHKYNTKMNARSSQSMLIYPQSFSEDFFTSQNDTCVDIWEKLSISGCIIIVDAISIFHPNVYHLFLQSEMSSNKQAGVAMLVLSPGLDSTNTKIQEKIKSRLLRAFNRFDRDDPLCELDFMKEKAFSRWLVNMAFPTVTKNLRTMARKVHPKPKPDVIKKLQQEIPDLPDDGNVNSWW